ncbi:MAG: family transcriptional regulator, cyclic receptor protein [Thermoleophilaceae bacterium]|jgi:CRP-like cAMP-binding protein|nr:family transcriptional regulator, cyclic receptor protein [Thermoleophilaceae bacterium]
MDADRLKSIPLFAGLNRKERRALGPRADEVELAQDREIVRQGEWPYEFFAIEEGTAEVRRGDQLLGELGPGDFFGEMALVGDTRRNATVVATSPVKVIVMTGPAFRQTARELPEVAAKIRAAVEERGRHLEAVV